MEVSEVQYESRYGNYRGSAKMDSFINLVHVVGLQRTASNCFKVHAARAARLFSLTRPIKFLICGEVDAVDGSLTVTCGCNCSGQLVLICIENRMNVIYGPE